MLEGCGRVGGWGEGVGDAEVREGGEGGGGGVWIRGGGGAGEDEGEMGWGSATWGG